MVIKYENKDYYGRIRRAFTRIQSSILLLAHFSRLSAYFCHSFVLCLIPLSKA